MEILEFVVLRLPASFSINALNIKWYSMPENLSLGFANRRRAAPVLNKWKVSYFNFLQAEFQFSS